MANKSIKKCTISPAIKNSELKRNLKKKTLCRVRKGKGASSTRGQSPDSPGDGKHSAGNAAGNPATTVRSARWAPGLSGGHFVNDIHVWPLCCTPETNIKSHWMSAVIEKNFKDFTWKFSKPRQNSRDIKYGCFYISMWISGHDCHLHRLPVSVNWWSAPGAVQQHAAEILRRSYPLAQQFIAQECSQ